MYRKSDDQFFFRRPRYSEVDDTSPPELAPTRLELPWNLRLPEGICLQSQPLNF